MCTKGWTPEELSIWGPREIKRTGEGNITESVSKHVSFSVCALRLFPMANLDYLFLGEKPGTTEWRFTAVHLIAVFNFRLYEALTTKFFEIHLYISYERRGQDMYVRTRYAVLDERRSTKKDETR